MMDSHVILFGFLIFLCGVEASAHVLVAKSEGTRRHLVELYSSESCSSCPPADRWISSLKDDTGLWKNFVPIVFHVDYWNYLGWKDDFSSNAMTKRQQELASTWSSPSVYTPAVVVDGREWRAWTHASLPDTGEATKIAVEIYQEGKRDFQVKVNGLSAGADYTVKMALLGMGLSTNVKGGENSGRTLEHNFVVLDWDGKTVNKNNTILAFHLSDKEKRAGKFAVVAWVEKAGHPQALQAAGGYLGE